MNYEIQISEEQRVILVEWARLASQLQAPDEDGLLLIGLLNCLPHAEELYPGGLHSFVY